MWIVESRKLLYLAPPKTGSTSMAQSLMQPPFLAESQTGEHGGHHRTEWNERFHDWKVMITTRNPYIRAWSLFMHARRGWRDSSVPNHAYWIMAFRKKRPETIQEFFRNPRVQDRLTTIWRCSWHVEQIPKQIDYCVHLESYEDDIKRISELAGLPHRHANKIAYGVRDPFQDLSEPAKRSVREVWGQDFERFGYDTDIRMLEAYQEGVT